MKCPVCELSYVPEYPPDAARHKREHDEFVNGVAARPMKDDLILVDDSTLYITLVAPTSSLNQRRRVERVARRANWETHYDFGIYGATESCNLEFNTHALVGSRMGRAVSLMLIERREHVWSAKWEPEGGIGDVIEIGNSEPRWTVAFVWTLAKCRRQGLARKMITEASKFTGVPESELGWYTPFTDSGRALAKRVCPDRFLIVK